MTHNPEPVKAELAELIREINAVTVIDEYQPALREMSKKLKRALGEFDAKQFFVLIVGPVKSGKSTLVNLFARERVSPVDFLESTIRPSIVAKHKEGEPTSIIQFKEKNRDLLNKQHTIDAFERILDYVREIDTLENISEDVSWREYPLVEENIDKYLRLPLDKKAIEDDDTLITLVSTKGGKLQNGETVIIDMPGLDGKYAHLENPIYNVIAKRADFVIFVQSTTSAISNVSNEFIEMLLKENKNVPIWLIHNIHESDNWRLEEERTGKIKKQETFARHELEKLGFKDILLTSINLGKVEDAIFERKVTEGNAEKLQQEKGRFEEMEEQLYHYLLKKREQIHIDNCLAKTHVTLTNSLSSVNHIQTGIATEIKRINFTRESLKGVSSSVDIIAYDDRDKTLSQLVTTIKGIIKEEKEKLIERMNVVYNDYKRDLGSARGSEVINKLERMREDCSKAVDTQLNYLSDPLQRINQYIKNIVDSCESAPIREINDKLSAMGLPVLEKESDEILTETFVEQVKRFVKDLKYTDEVEGYINNSLAKMQMEPVEQVKDKTIPIGNYTFFMRTDSIKTRNMILLPKKYSAEEIRGILNTRFTDFMNETETKIPEFYSREIILYYALAMAFRKHNYMNKLEQIAHDYEKEIEQRLNRLRHADEFTDRLANHIKEINTTFE